MDGTAVTLEPGKTYEGVIVITAAAASGEPSGEGSSEEPAVRGSDVSEEAYHAYLKEYVSAVPAAQEHLDEYFAGIDASDYGTMPIDMLFSPEWWGYAAMTYEEFVAANGVYEIPAFDPNLVPD